MKFILPLRTLKKDVDLYLTELEKHEICYDHLIQYVLAVWDILRFRELFDYADHFQGVAFEVIYTDLNDAGRLPAQQSENYTVTFDRYGNPLPNPNVDPLEVSEAVVIYAVEATELIFNQLLPYLKQMAGTESGKRYDYIQVEGFIGQDLVLEPTIIEDSGIEYVTPGALPSFL